MLYFHHNPGEREQTSLDRKSSLPPIVCLCVIHQRLTGHNEKTPWMYYVYVVCLTRFHGDLCTAHFLILFNFLAFPQHLFCPFLIKVWSWRTELRAGVGLNNGAERSEWDVCFHAIVPFQRAVSEIAQLSTLPCPLFSPRAPNLHSSPLPPQLVYTIS